MSNDTISAEQPWSSEDIRLCIEDVLMSDETDPVWYVSEIMKVLNLMGYDSVDREISFSLVSTKLWISYDVMYQIWLEGTYPGGPNAPAPVDLEPEPVNVSGAEVADMIAGMLAVPNAKDPLGLLEEIRLAVNSFLPSDERVDVIGLPV